LKDPNGGRAEGTPTVFALILRGGSEILARLRAPFCCGGGGSKSNTIFAIFQKEFLFENIF
jgi:hypothetical protein